MSAYLHSSISFIHLSGKWSLLILLLELKTISPPHGKSVSLGYFPVFSLLPWIITPFLIWIPPCLSPARHIFKYKHLFMKLLLQKSQGQILKAHVQEQYSVSLPTTFSVFLKIENHTLFISVPYHLAKQFLWDNSNNIPTKVGMLVIFYRQGNRLTKLKEFIQCQLLNKW